MSNNEQELPWYRQFWPWFIAFPPAATVVAGAVTAWLAGAGPALVVDDYGQIGKVTMQRAVRDERAGELGLSARVGLEAVEPGNEAAVGVDLSLVASDVELPDAVVLQIVHPTLADQDVDTILTGSRGHYVGRTIRPVGRLYIHVSDVERTWRLVGELSPGATRLILMPKADAARR